MDHFRKKIYALNSLSVTLGKFSHQIWTNNYRNPSFSKLIFDMLSMNFEILDWNHPNNIPAFATLSFHISHFLYWISQFLEWQKKLHIILLSLCKTVVFLGLKQRGRHSLSQSNLGLQLNPHHFARNFAFDIICASLSEFSVYYL